jgi:hypothetical protein
VLPKVMFIQYEGGEYASVNLSGLKDQPDPAWAILDEAGSQLRKPSTTGNVGLHVYDTKLDRPTVQRLVDWLSTVSPHVYRLAFIGASVRGKRLLRRELKHQNLNLNHTFLFDLDEAKDWLVGRHRPSRY